jgi:hypothetical protein
MSALSHGVVRVDNENSLTSLTLQDAGQVITGGAVITQFVNCMHALNCRCGNCHQNDWPTEIV